MGTESRGKRTHHATLKRGARRVFEIVTLLAERGSRVTSGEIYSTLREKGERLSLSSIYRALAALEDAGLIRREIGNANSSYAIASGELVARIVEADTGEIVEIPAQALESALRVVAAKAGFEASRFRITIFGRRKGRRRQSPQ